MDAPLIDLLLGTPGLLLLAFVVLLAWHELCPVD